MLDGFCAGFRSEPRRLRAEHSLYLIIPRVEGLREVSRAIGGDPAAHGPRLEHGHGQTRVLEQHGARDAGDTTADHGHVYVNGGLLVTRPPELGSDCLPDRLGAHGEHA